MALADFLSAVRVLIMDMDTLPGTEGERLQCYKRSFPMLSDDELADLSRVPPKQLREYTSTIFHGERSMISNHFPTSLALMQRDWKEVFGTPLRLYDFIQAMHHQFPWKSHRTIDFARNVVKYTSSSELARLVASLPALPDIARLELAALQIKRFPDERLSSRDSLTRDEIAPLTVQDVLELECVIPESVFLGEFEHDVVSIWGHFRSNSRQLPDSFEKRSTCVAGGRNRNLFPRFVEISASQKEGISGLLRARPIALEVLAGHLISAEQSADEVELFTSFLNLVLTLADAGVLVIGRPGSLEVASGIGRSEDDGRQVIVEG